MVNGTIAFLALAIEAICGYPAWLYRAAGHPVTWMGALIGVLDRRLNRARDCFALRRSGGFAALGIILIVTAVAGSLVQGVALAALPKFVATGALAVLASACLAQRSLDAHVRAVATALQTSGLDAGRGAVAMIVGRDTANLDEPGIARAAIESLAENFSDGILAPALFLAIGGLPGGFCYKAINTADSMIGHRTPRHEAFGYAAAKLDDIVNWPAARLAALAIVAAALFAPGASPERAWRIMWRDAGGHPSPNAGWPEAAMAGALGVKLGGTRSYGGQPVEDAEMGEGAEASMRDIVRALHIYRLACGLNALFVLLLVFVSARF